MCVWEGKKHNTKTCQRTCKILQLTKAGNIQHRHQTTHTAKHIHTHTGSHELISIILGAAKAVLKVFLGQNSM